MRKEAKRAAASLAASRGAPDMEPERSSTRATLIGGRRDGGFTGQGDQHADLVGVLGGQELGGQTDVGLHAVSRLGRSW